MREETTISSGDSPALFFADAPGSYVGNPTTRYCARCEDPIALDYRPPARRRKRGPRYCGRDCYLLDVVVPARPGRPPTSVLSPAAVSALVGLVAAPRLLPPAMRAKLWRLGLVTPTGKGHKTVRLNSLGKRLVRRVSG